MNPQYYGKEYRRLETEKNDSHNLARKLKYHEGKNPPSGRARMTGKIGYPTLRLIRFAIGGL
jgi:16S rRNA U516 pseudouridylate synthase RsuA-like enzyme